MFNVGSRPFEYPLPTINMKLEIEQSKGRKRHQGEDAARDSKRPRREQVSSAPQINTNSQKVDALIFVFNASIQRLQDTNLCSEKISFWINHLVNTYKTSCYPWESIEQLETALNNVYMDAEQEFSQGNSHELSIQIECTQNILMVFQETLEYKRTNNTKSLDTLAEYFTF